MKVTLHMATSIDGCIASADGNSSWVSARDEELFMQRCRDAGAMAVGRRTYEQYLGSIYPVPGSDNIILSRSASGQLSEHVHYVIKRGG